MKLKRIAVGVLLGAMSVVMWSLPAAADPIGDGTRVTSVGEPNENNW